MGQALSARAILIVEDEVLIRHDLMDFFEDRGFDVFEAENGDEAIQLLAANPQVQVVLTDVRMNGEVDGLWLARYVRDRCSSTLIAVMSGNIGPLPSDLPPETLFFAKPFDPRRILREIERRCR